MDVETRALRHARGTLGRAHYASIRAKVSERDGNRGGLGAAAAEKRGCGPRSIPSSVAQPVVRRASRMRPRTSLRTKLRTEDPRDGPVQAGKGSSSLDYRAVEWSKIHVDFGGFSQYRKAHVQLEGSTVAVCEGLIAILQTCSGGSMRKERLRKIVCTTLVVMVAVLGLVTIAMAQEDAGAADGMILKKGPHVPSANRVQPQPNSSLAPPANDECAGATVIPDGPYPVCSAITTGILDATDTGDPRVTGTCSGNFNSRNSIWYTWTPSVTAFYKIITCPGGNCGPGTTLTEPGDGILHVYTAARSEEHTSELQSLRHL